jgi:hypothetical protein
MWACENTALLGRSAHRVVVGFFRQTGWFHHTPWRAARAVPREALMTGPRASRSRVWAWCCSAQTARLAAALTSRSARYPQPGQQNTRCDNGSFSVGTAGDEPTTLDPHDVAAGGQAGQVQATTVDTARAGAWRLPAARPVVSSVAPSFGAESGRDRTREARGGFRGCRSTGSATSRRLPELAVHSFFAADTSMQTTPSLPSWSAITVSEGALLSSTTVPPAATAAAIRCSATSGAT